MNIYALIITLFCIFVAMPESESADPFQSPEVHADGSVTFRLHSPAARSVTVSISGRSLQLTTGKGDVWSGITSPLRPGIHDYSFDVDGTRMIDPANRNVKKWYTLASMVEIPGTPPRLTEFIDVPHGVVQRLIYPSTTVARPRPVVVYTPPGYDPSGDIRYPLVVLMHGFGDDETAWTEVGRVHLIADNLLAAGDIERCIIAMPDGHPIPRPYGKRPNDYFVRNNDLYEADITQDLLPFLEQNFRLSSGVADRSIVGLSMGGGHAIHVGLRNIDTFSSIGAFSAAAPQSDKEDLPTKYPALFGSKPAANQLQHFWIPIGDTDFLLKRNLDFVAILKEQAVNHDFKLTHGGHEWKVWRDYVAEFLQMAHRSDRQ